MVSRSGRTSVAAVVAAHSVVGSRVGSGVAGRRRTNQSRRRWSPMAGFSAAVFPVGAGETQRRWNLSALRTS